MFNGIKGMPSRTSRTQAESIGTAAGMLSTPDYDAQAGVPMGSPVGSPGQHYADPAAGLGTLPKTPVAQSVPFRLGGG
jgi:hypothetical protein